MNPYNMTEDQVRNALSERGLPHLRVKRLDLLRLCLAECLWPDLDTARESVARALFLVAYSDAVENEELDAPRPGGGEDWDDFAPETPESAKQSGNDLIRAFEIINGLGSFGELSARWIEISGQSADRFGHCFAMQALGTGVGLDDDVPADCPTFEPAPHSCWEYHYEE